MENGISKNQSLMLGSELFWKPALYSLFNYTLCAILSHLPEHSIIFHLQTLKDRNVFVQVQFSVPRLHLRLGTLNQFNTLFFWLQIKLCAVTGQDIEQKSFHLRPNKGKRQLYWTATLRPHLFRLAFGFCIFIALRTILCLSTLKS